MERFTDILLRSIFLFLIVAIAICCGYVGIFIGNYILANFEAIRPALGSIGAVFIFCILGGVVWHLISSKG